MVYTKVESRNNKYFAFRHALLFFRVYAVQKDGQSVTSPISFDITILWSAVTIHDFETVKRASLGLR